jgi:rhodanese-related sulfurtransferase
VKLNLKKIIAIILTSVFISFVYNDFNPNGLKLIRDERVLNWESDSLSSFPQTNSLAIDSNLTINKPIIDSSKTEIKKEDSESFKEPKAIKLDFAYKLFKQGIKFIDARPVDEYTEGHIKGAVNIPFYGSENYTSVLNKISKDEIVVTYCSGEDCDLSILLGDELFSKGYKKVYVFFGGWNDWLIKGYPADKQ